MAIAVSNTILDSTNHCLARFDPRMLNGVTSPKIKKAESRSIPPCESYVFLNY